MGLFKLLCKFCERFSCSSSCKISEGEKVLWQFKKTLTLEELEIIKEVIENKRNGLTL
jgi:hypothetical protein